MSAVENSPTPLVPTDQSSTATMMEVEAAADAGPSALEQAMEAALKKMSEEKKQATVGPSTNHLLKMLQKLQKDPRDVKNRKMNISKNFLFPKYIGGVQGAEDFLAAVGFRREKAGKGAKAVEVLIIPPGAIQGDVLSKAIELLVQRLEEIKTGQIRKAAVAAGPRVRCKCGFWGDPNTENMCSKCYKAQYLGAPKEEKKAAPAVRVPCKGAGCNFWGSESTKGFCSSCFKKEQDLHPTPWRETMADAMLKLKAVRRLEENIQPVQEHKNCCWLCRKKVGITGIECRCRYIFCGKHRYADAHNCPYDHKKQQRRKLERELEVVAAKKFDTIDDD